MADPRPCLVCGGAKHHPAHGDRLGGSKVNAPRGLVSAHPYDPGERRQFVRRMDDRVAAIERAMGLRRPPVERRSGQDRRH